MAIHQASVYGDETVSVGIAHLNCRERWIVGSVIRKNDVLSVEPKRTEGNSP